MQIETQENIIKRRLEVDERPLKKVARRVLALARQGQAISEHQAEEHALQGDFNSFDHTLRRLMLLVVANERDTEHYRREMENMTSTYASAQAEISRLRMELVSESQARADRAAFDALAIDIESSAPRWRKSQLSSILKLEDEIKELQDERRDYNETWQLRKIAFEDIMTKLTRLQNEIAGEKADAELRDAVEDSDEDEGALPIVEAVQDTVIATQEEKSADEMHAAPSALNNKTLLHNDVPETGQRDNTSEYEMAMDTT